jgi:DNA polymerase III delta prime subunit
MPVRECESANHTVRRLQQICGFEGLKADARALTTLVGVAKGDLRGCLNTLQVQIEHISCVASKVYQCP